jgi:hypothetical protein
MNKKNGKRKVEAFIEIFIKMKSIKNLLQLFNKIIYEIIYTFVKTTSIFQPPHSMKFMDLNNIVVYITPPFPKN